MDWKHKTYYTADLHFGHENVLKYCNRPFTDVDHMNSELVKRWNTKVTSADTVYVLGDVALGKLVDSLKFVAQLNGNKFLVPGNHDRCWNGHRKIRPIDIQRYTDVGFTILDSKVPGPHDSKLCHFPYEGDSHEEDRYVEFRPKPSFEGQFLIHGHCHTEWRVRGRQINVGVDVWDYYPVSEYTITTIMDAVDHNEKYPENRWVL